MKSTIDKGILFCDLCVVSIWLFISTWYAGGYSLFTLAFFLPIAAARLVLSFGLYYRVAKIRLAVIAYVIILALFTFLDANTVLDLCATPFLKFLRIIWSILTQHEGYDQPMFISHFIENYNKGLCPPLMYVLAIALMVLFCGMPIFEVIWYSTKNKKDNNQEENTNCHWPWKKLILGFVLYAICSAVIMGTSINYLWIYTIYPKLVLSLILVGCILFAYHKGLTFTKIEKVYILVMAVILVATQCGLVKNPWCSLVFMIVCPALVIWYFARKYKLISSAKMLWTIVLLVLVVNVLIWSLSFTTGTYKVFTLLAIIACALAGIWLYRTEKISHAWSVVIIGLTIGFLPVLSLGYNPVDCWNSAIVENTSVKDSKYYTLMAVKNKDGYGLRDSFGYVLNPEYKSLEYMYGYSPLFMVENDNGKFGVYDITEGKFLLECKYSSIRPMLDEEGENSRLWEINTTKDGETTIQYLQYDRGKYFVTDHPLEYSN